VSWLVPPVTRLRDGWLDPVRGLSDRLTPEAERYVRACATIDTSGAPLLLRGSLLERPTPHPGADVDLLLVAPVGVSIDLSPVRALGRPIDALRLDPGDPDLVLLSLAWTRSLTVAGPAFPLLPVRVDDAWLEAHWFRYGALHVPGILRSQGPRRVSDTKQLLRAAALVRVRTHGEWSRDLSTCARWIAEDEPSLSPSVGALLGALDGDPMPEVDVRDLQHWLRIRWREVR
jgi:hypothetical protein